MLLTIKWSRWYFITLSSGPRVVLCYLDVDISWGGGVISYTENILMNITGIKESKTVIMFSDVILVNPPPPLKILRAAPTTGWTPEAVKEKIKISTAYKTDQINQQIQKLTLTLRLEIHLMFDLMFASGRFVIVRVTILAYTRCGTCDTGWHH